jgi:DNA replication protein DnaC
MDNVQQQILDRVERGQSVFFTGSAGTGKTYTMNQIVNRLKVKYGREFSKKVAVAAMTGLAASHINGVTLYAALGIGIAKRVGDVGNGMHRKAKDVNQLDVLIVDECSMLSAELLHIIVSDPLITRRKTPLQLIFCGDFYQV